MPAPYSLDLRLRCLEAIRRGETEKAVAEWAGISVRTLRYWKSREREQGHAKPITDYKRGAKSKVNDEKLKACIEEAADKGLKAIGKILGCHETTVGRHLKVLGYTRKKRHFYTVNEKKSNELNLKKS
jgi:transposase